MMNKSSKWHHTYNAASLAQVTIEQIVKDYFQYHLGEKGSFPQSENDTDKNVSVIWMVVKTALHFPKKS